MTAKPKLNISVDEAQQKIDLQITRGKSISKFTVSSIGDLERCEEIRHEWYDFTKTLLELMDDNDELVKDFHYLTPSVAVSGNDSLNTRMHNFRYHMKKDLGNLRTIYNKLPLLQTKSKSKRQVRKKFKNKPEFLNAHFFFVDIVCLSDWSNSSTEEQIAKINKLTSIIESCKTFESATADEKFVLPTGDGMVIGFTNNISAPLDLAIETHKKLSKHNKNKNEFNKIKIRIGIHSAPVLKFIDVLGNENVWGEGIIIARRIMDLGNADHILISSKMAKEIYQLSTKYRKNLHKIGTSKIKHGDVVEMYSVHGNGFGNAKPPKLNKEKLEEYKESDARKIKREIELLKAQKKRTQSSKNSWKEHYTINLLQIVDHLN